MTQRLGGFCASEVARELFSVGARISAEIWRTMSSEMQR